MKLRRKKARRYIYIYIYIHTRREGEGERLHMPQRDHTLGEGRGGERCWCARGEVPRGETLIEYSSALQMCPFRIVVSTDWSALR